MIALAGGYDTELLDERAIDAGTINVGENKKITGYTSDRSSNHRWTSSNDSVASVAGNDNVGSVTGISNGTVTITHTYYYSGSGVLYPAGDYTQKWTVTVKDWKEKAGLYILYDPEKEPDSNDTSMWTSVVTVNGQHAKLGDLTGATWTNDKNIFFRNIGGADGTTAQQYIKHWPDEAVYNGPRTLNPGDPFRQTYVTYNKGANSDTLEDMILKMYKGKLVKMYTDSGSSLEEANGIVNSLNARDITFSIIPHKISKSNSTNPDKHIDCTVTVTCDKTFTAKFNVKKPGESGYTTVNSKLYLWKERQGNKVAKYESATAVPSEITMDDGSKWNFVGWYPENDDDTGPNKDNGVISDTEWPYAVKMWQLNNHNKDRVVNFYAHYEKATSNVTITKQVTGLLGDTNKEFTFNVSITQNKVACTGVTAKKGDQTVSDLTNFTLTNFTLKHNETVTLENVPIGATITVTEVNPGDHYTVSANGKAGVEDASGNVTFTYVAVANTPTTTANDTGEAALMLLSMDEDTAVDADGDAVAYDVGARVKNNQIIVTNHCGLLPDTGVLLDTLPYIVILAVVAGGVALLMLRKHRKEDD